MKKTLFTLSVTALLSAQSFSGPWDSPSPDFERIRPKHDPFYSQVEYPNPHSGRHWDRRHYQHRRPAAVIFENSQHRGARFALGLGEEIRDLGQFQLDVDSWNDEISSIDLREGVSIILYEHSHFRGRRITLDRSIRRLSSLRNHYGSFDNWNDRVSSIRVIPSTPHRDRYGDDNRDRRRSDKIEKKQPAIMLFSDSRFSGKRLPLREGDSIPNLSRIDWNDTISSIRLNEGVRIQLFEHANFRGRSVIINADQHNMNYIRPDRSYYGRTEGWNDRVSSLRVISSKKISYVEGRPSEKQYSWTNKY